MNMSVLMVAHTLVGSVTVLAGFAALLASKGSRTHLLAGQLFVMAVLLMGPIIAVEALILPGRVSALGIVFTLFMGYLTVSAWATIHRSGHQTSLLDRAAPIVALCICMAAILLGFEATGNPHRAEHLPPIEAYLFFAALAFFAMLLDINNLRIGGVRGKHRIARHVWRMTCALFFATSTLFTGPGSIILPESVRGSPGLLLPQSLVLVSAIAWMYRLMCHNAKFTTNTHHTK